MKTNVRLSSLSAYFYLHGSNTLLNQKGKIVEDLIVANRPLTRVEVSERTGIRINAVCGRVNELIKDGYIKEGNKRTCLFTKMYVNTILLTGKV